MYIKHSKFKNTGILFEVIVRKITSETLSGNDSPAIKILKSHFVNTELGKEYKLYETIFKSKNSDYSRASTTLDIILESSKKLNRSAIRKDKYNLIKDLKEHYNVEDLFKTKLNDYKAQASLYTLLEVYNTDKLIDPNQIIDNKVTLLEYLTLKEVTREGVKEDVLEEFKSQDKDIRTLTYYVLLEKFNDRYSSLNSRQKNILKEFIESVDNTSSLKDFYNKEVIFIKESITHQILKTKSEVIKIKLNEVSSLIKELDKRSNINNNHLVDLLQYHSLIEELKKSNG
jgi:bisphosphoglycerate-dependent phosphoglycerate mutase